MTGQAKRVGSVMKTAKEWFEDAQKNSYAIGAFNVDSLHKYVFMLICLQYANRKNYSGT